ncbi:amidohydrolase family protein [Agromyces sp. MMS24-K17]|uniref:amidohydrolase family protein n=1 Tax=Agromyces sp. MMS24-K17 TaxID=3372850 RepID=UPI003753FBE6
MTGPAPAGIVDAHVHLWDVDRMRLSWWRPELRLPRAATTGALRDAARAVTAPRPVRGAIAVQAADTLGEAAWLAGVALGDPFVRAVVLQYDARSDPSAWAGMAQPVVDGGRASVAGIRLATPGGAADFGDVAGLDALCDGLAATGRVLELLIRAEQLPAAAALARRHPELAVVVCHLAIGGDAPDPAWRRAIGAFAAEPNASAKVSGLVRDEPGDAARVRAIVHHAVDAFGADRLLFGSDWPISARFADYDVVVRRTAAALPDLDDAARAAFWSGTATRRYALATA